MRRVKRVRRYELPKRKVIRVEPEETQDYVRESLDLSREEAEEISFVPSTISIPRGLMLWCDNRCSDKAIRFLQFASAVIDDGVEVLHGQFVPAVFTTRACHQECALLNKPTFELDIEAKAISVDKVRLQCSRCHRRHSRTTHASGSNIAICLARRAVTGTATQRDWNKAAPLTFH